MSPSTVLFCGLPAFGHLYSMIPLALAARDAGHEVIFATGAPFVGRLRAIGFETHRAGISVQEGVTALFGGQPAPRRPTAGPTRRLGRPCSWMRWPGRWHPTWCRCWTVAPRT